MQRYKFNTRVREEGESIAAYVTSLREIAEHCHYGDSSSEMLRDRLVCGVRHEGIQKRLLSEKDLTFETAYDLALSIETAERDSKSISTQRGNGQVHYIQAGFRHQPRNLYPPAPKKGISCYRCGGEHNYGKHLQILSSK